MLALVVLAVSLSNSTSNSISNSSSNCTSNSTRSTSNNCGCPHEGSSGLPVLGGDHRVHDSAVLGEVLLQILGGDPIRQAWGKAARTDERE